MALALVGCGSQPLYVDLPSNHGHDLDAALRRLHAVGLRASFPAVRTPCGDGLPSVDVQSPRAPARVERGSVVTLKFMYSMIPSPAVPIHHARWAYVPQLVGEDFGVASNKLHAIWPCVHVQAATATSAARMIIAAQSPQPGARVPAFGVLSGRGYRPTTVNVTVAAASSRATAAGLLRIEKLNGALVRLGTWGSGANASALYGVRLRATLCLGSAAEAVKTYPSEITITHFAVRRSPQRWWAARTAIDRAPWLVPFGESWRGKRCGPVVLEDPIPSDHYGVESLGNPNGCYGVSLAIRAGASRTAKRTIVKCGPRFG
jgi:hypothetical protein